MHLQSQRIVTATLVGSAFLTGVDLFIVNVAFDDIARDLGNASTTLSQLSWILNAYAVVFAALLIPMGRMGDRYGNRLVFILGLSLFTLSSAACAAASSVWMLVAFRGVQAVGAAAMTPTSLGLLLASLPAAQRRPAARAWAMTGALATSVGPALGGGLVSLSWRWAFLINVPVGILMLVAALRYVPDVRHDKDTPRPDLLGAALLTACIAALVLAIVQSSDWGWVSSGVITALVAALVLGGAFAWRTARHASPMIDTRLFATRSFPSAAATTLVFNLGFAGSLLALILWMQEVWHWSALTTGLCVALGPLLVPITSLLAHRIAPAMRPAIMICAGCIVCAAGAALTAVSLRAGANYWIGVLPGWLLGGVGVGLAMPNLVAAGTAELPPAATSTGGGVISMARQVGMAFGIAVLVTIIANKIPRDALPTALLVVACMHVAAALVATLMLRPNRQPAAATSAPQLSA